MKLPNSELASVPTAKITNYLLSTAHPEGASKAVFFRTMGFAPERWTDLADALKRQARDHDVAGVYPSTFGVRYRIEGPLKTPRGKSPIIRSIWFIDSGASVPRLVTAYPATPIHRAG